MCIDVNIIRFIFGFNMPISNIAQCVSSISCIWFLGSNPLTLLKTLAFTYFQSDLHPFSIRDLMERDKKKKKKSTIFIAIAHHWSIIFANCQLLLIGRSSSFSALPNPFFLSLIFLQFYYSSSLSCCLFFLLLLSFPSCCMPLKQSINLLFRLT